MAVSAPDGVQEASGEKMPAPIPCRRFGLVNGMIAVAAVAVGLAVARLVWMHYGRLLSGIPLDRDSGISAWWAYLSHHPRVVLALLVFSCAVLIVLLLVASLAFVAMRMRRPRPPMGRVSLQPGMVAVEAMWASLITSMILDGFDLAPVFGMLALSLPVPAAWSALALTGRWQPEPGWIDRFGRALGVRWCLLILLYLVAAAAFSFLTAP